MSNGDHLAFGGGGLVCEPMAFAWALGPAPDFRAARESKTLPVTEMSEFAVAEPRAT